MLASQASHGEIAIPAWKDGHVTSHTLHTQEAQACAMSLQAKWAWTSGAATAVMDLERWGVGGGTVATKTAHDLSRLDQRAIENLVALQLLLACHFPASTIGRWET